MAFIGEAGFQGQQLVSNPTEQIAKGIETAADYAIKQRSIDVEMEKVKATDRKLKQDQAALLVNHGDKIISMFSDASMIDDDRKRDAYLNFATKQLGAVAPELTSQIASSYFDTPEKRATLQDLAQKYANSKPGPERTQYAYLFGLARGNPAKMDQIIKFSQEQADKKYNAEIMAQGQNDRLQKQQAATSSRFNESEKNKQDRFDKTKQLQLDQTDKARLSNIAKELRSQSSPYGKSEGAYASSLQGIELLKSNTVLNAEVVKRFLLKATGDSRPSDKDIEGFGGDVSLIGQIFNRADKLANSKISEASRKTYIDTLTQLANFHKQAANYYYEKTVDSVKPLLNNPDDTKIRQALGAAIPNYKSTAKPKPPEDQGRQQALDAINKIKSNPNKYPGLTEQSIRTKFKGMYGKDL